MEERGRSLDSVIDQYLGVVKPMYHQFIEPTSRYADIVIPEGVSNTVVIDLLDDQNCKDFGRSSKQQIIRCGGLASFFLFFSLVLVHKWRFFRHILV